MKNTKNLASIAVLFVFVILATASDASPSEWGLVIFILILILGSIMFVSNTNSKAKLEETKEKNKEKWNNITTENQREYDQLVFKYGTPSKTINYNHSQYFLVYEEKSMLIINEHKYDFKDILGFNISDNSKVIYTPTTSETSTNTGSMLGRAVVGGVLTGSVGAIIGGATAKKNTTTSGGTSSTRHSYTIIVTVNSISNPIEKISLENQEGYTNEIAAILQIILNKNQNQ